MGLAGMGVRMEVHSWIGYINAPEQKGSEMNVTFVVKCTPIP
jgi:hypothetical protein